MSDTDPTETFDIDVNNAEKAIQKTLLELEAKTGAYIDYVEVDIRNWAQLRTSVFLTKKVRQ